MATRITPPTEPNLPSADYLNLQFKTINDSLKEVKDTLKEMSEQAVPRAELVLMFKERDDKISAIQTEVGGFKTNNRWWFRAVVGSALSALFLALATLIFTVTAGSFR